jgi:membrane protein
MAAVVEQHGQKTHERAIAMKLLQRHPDRHAPEDAPTQPGRQEGPQPQPEREEPKLADPAPSDLSRRDYVAILRRAFKEASADHITNMAAALAYYAFLAIPSALLVGVGVFSLVAGPDTINTLVDKLGTIMPGEATKLIDDSLTRMTEKQATGAALIGSAGY